MQRIALYGGSFNPPGIHHTKIVEHLLERFDIVIVIPCCVRKDKKSVESLSLKDRKELVARAFDFEGVICDYYDLDNDVFTPTHLLQERYAKYYPDAEIWHVVGADIVMGGNNKTSQIHRVWIDGETMWQALHFFIISREGYELREGDVPLHSQVSHFNRTNCSSTMIRNCLSEGKNASLFLSPAVYEYIKEHRLYINLDNK
ncbi:MAG: hypothetical protein HZA36_02590 [Parcubacteria group bacterium]|nr:hypothetical protein [Parcubacteria group bacterium]